ncbi:hypothetical protein EON82_05605 [bacterium]|nr:MAG: hypothetical protein EON82_05605 [bacterium]
MKEALLGLILGLGTGALSVWSLWLITGFTAKAASGIYVEPPVDRPTGWDKEWDEIDDEEKSIKRFFRRPEQDVNSSTTSDPTPSTWGATTSHPSADPPPQGEGDLRAATFRVFFAFLLKAPILYAIARVAQSMGDVALHWCVGGVVLVYFLAVFYAARRTNRR